MPKWLAIVVVIALVGSMVAISSIPIWQRRESTLGRRALTWIGMIGMLAVGIAVVAFVAAAPS